DPQRKTAVTTIVRGAAYKRPGHWQQLELAEVPKLLADQVRVLRATPGAAIDPREAFVDAIVLIVPGNSAAIEVGTDELEVDGVVLSSAKSPTAVTQAGAASANKTDTKKSTV